MVYQRIALALCLLFGEAWTAAAQDAYPRSELFVGYSFLPADEADDWPRSDSSGVQGSVALNVNRWFGIVGDFGAQFATTTLSPLYYPPSQYPSTVNVRVYQYLAGARFAARRRPATVFAQALVGGATGSTSLGGFSSNSGFTFGGGGGVDVRVRGALAIRTQVDLLLSLAEVVEDNFRFGIGIVVGLGRK